MIISGKKSIVIAFVLTLWCSVVLSKGNKTSELVLNPTFKPSEKKNVPAHWSIWRPVWEKASCIVETVSGGLFIDGRSNPYAVGGVFQAIQNIESGQAYAIEAICQLRNIPTPYQSVLVRISWAHDRKLLHPAGMLVRGSILDGKLARFNDVLVAPKQANSAKISLEVKWPHGGSVLWKHVSVRPTSAPVPRKIKVGTVYLRPKNSTPKNNLKLFCEQIDRAGIKPNGSLSIHTLRKSAGQNWADNIPNPNVTKELMGHSSLTTTMKFYNQVDADHRAKAAAAIDDLLASSDDAGTEGSEKSDARVRF